MGMRALRRTHAAVLSTGNSKPHGCHSERSEESHVRCIREGDSSSLRSIGMTLGGWAARVGGRRAYVNEKQARVIAGWKNTSSVATAKACRCATFPSRGRLRGQDGERRVWECGSAHCHSVCYLRGTANPTAVIPNTVRNPMSGALEKGIPQSLRSIGMTLGVMSGAYGNARPATHACGCAIYGEQQTPRLSFRTQ